MRQRIPPRHIRVDVPCQFPRVIQGQVNTGDDLFDGPVLVGLQRHDPHTSGAQRIGAFTISVLIFTSQNWACAYYSLEPGAGNSDGLQARIASHDPALHALRSYDRTGRFR